MLAVTLDKIKEARRVLNQYIVPTPLLHNPWLSEDYGADVYLKLETMQPIGSFKIRGATYKISKLKPPELKKGVVAASAGNHGQGVAWGARRLGTHATIVMPKGASLTKVQRCRALGAEVVLQGETYDDSYSYAHELCKKLDRVFVHPYEDEDVISGQGTVALEILEQLPDVDVIVGSIGGGGMLGGLGSVIKAMKPDTHIVGAQSSGAPSMVTSLAKGHAVSSSSVHTFADGIAVSKASEEMRKLLEPLVDEVLEVEDEATAAAVLTLMEKAKVVAEGAGALPLAALDKIHKGFKNKKIVLVISGGNIDVNLISRIIDRGLIKAGRRLRLDVLIPDKPGALHHLTGMIAKEEANIIQAFHDRNEPSGSIHQIHLALTLETKGPDHSDRLIELIEKNVEKFQIVH